jgi:MerR family transcriptional regulator, heat shock protein HspR
MGGRKKAGYMISAVAELYGIHPQTLRLYEREGLLRPSRSEGNTRLYTQEDLQRLELILNLTRDLGVNLAGVEIILTMRERMEAQQQQVSELIQYVQTRMQAEISSSTDAQKALVRMPPSKVVRLRR